LDRWQKTAPSPIKEQIGRYRVLGKILNNDWQGLIDELESGELKTPPANTLLSYARAYAELGRIDRATECLIAARLAESRAGVKTLSLTLLPYFALAADAQHTDSLLENLSGALPDRALNYWRARRLLASGDLQGAQALFEEALHNTQSAATISGAWVNRIQSFLDRLSAGEFKPGKHNWSSETARVWHVFEQAQFVNSIIQPYRHAPIVGALCVIIAVSFAIQSVYAYIPNDTTIEISKNIFSSCLLDPHKVLAGEYWRLFTYLFLHKDPVHLVVNLIGLYWFGRIAFNIYGTARFLFIFSVSGMLSGIAQTLMAPDVLAVGASGGVMGVLGAVAAGIFRLKEYLPDRVRKIELYWLAGLALSSVVADQFSPLIASYAHAGGMVAGLAFGFIVRLPKPQYAVTNQKTPKAATKTDPTTN
ncbi:MAG TPA: rhomboid family intramembrane serine protease, partial [Chroococcales cyanobacterium]